MAKGRAILPGRRAHSYPLFGWAYSNEKALSPVDVINSTIGRFSRLIRNESCERLTLILWR
jgi:hypothetical protein